MRVLIAGCGDVGEALGLRLCGQGHEVWGLRRNPEGLAEGIRGIAADLTRRESLEGLPEGLDVVFYAAAADRGDEEAYDAVYVRGVQELLDALVRQGQTPRRVFFTSSTSVYGQQDGAWVDEESETAPAGFSGQKVLAGERVLLEGPFAATVVRLGGIYGPGRTRLLRMVREGRASYTEEPRYTNRIHREDCAGVLAHLMALEEVGSLYIGVDDAPAPKREVLLWMAQQLGAPVPPLAEKETSSRRTRTNKRCRNALLRASGYTFRFPSYKEGYQPLIDALRRQGD